VRITGKQYALREKIISIAIAGMTKNLAVLVETVEKLRMKHKCHAYDCEIEVPPKMFMCKKHWLMVPKWHQDLIWELYTKGQEIDKTPSRQYLQVTDRAKWFVRGREYQQSL